MHTNDVVVRLFFFFVIVYQFTYFIAFWCQFTTLLTSTHPGAMIPILVTPWNSELRNFLTANSSNYSVVEVNGEELIQFRSSCLQSNMETSMPMYIICNFPRSRSKSKTHLRTILFHFEGEHAKISFYMPARNWNGGSSVRIFELLKIIIGHDFFTFIQLVVHPHRKMKTNQGIQTIHGLLPTALDFTRNRIIELKEINLYSVSELLDDFYALLPFQPDSENESASK